VQAVLNPQEDVVMQDTEVEPDDEPHAVCFEALEGGEALLSAAACADLPGEDEGFTPLTDVELVQLVLSDNAPGLVDVLDTDKQIIPEIGLSSCLTALELAQVTLSANCAFSAETGRQACRRD
jgi:hypothetical protein